MTDGTSTKPMVIVGGGKAGDRRGNSSRRRFRWVRDRRPGTGYPVWPSSAVQDIFAAEEDLEGWYVKPANWCEAHDVELRTGSDVVAVDAAAHSVVLDSGQELEYQKVLLTTGGRNRQLAIPGAELPGIYYLRTVAECDAIKHEAVAGRRAVVVGMGSSAPRAGHR